MKPKRYTIGEIVRLGLLRNMKGKSYRDKASVLRVILRRFPTLLRRPTPHGMGYEVPQVMIDTINAEHAKYRV